MRRALLVLLLLASAPIVRAEERFLITRIEVRNLAHASADVIKSESRLREKESYDESELREANDRIRRLPFVLDASFSLERGEAHGEHVLVVTVTETRPIFFRFDLVPFLQSRDNLGFIGNDSLLGGRWFAGRRDVFHLAGFSHESERPFESSYVALQAGYTRYGLFDDRAFATLTVSRYAPYSNSGQTGRLVPGAVLGVSLSPNRTLTISYSGVDSGVSARRAERILEARLAHNTTDHPYFPSKGSVLSVAPVVAWIDAIGRDRVAFHDFDLAIDAHAARYWTLNERLTGAAIFDGGAVHVDQRKANASRKFNVAYGSATFNLLRAIGDTNRESDRRIELSLRVATHHREVVPFADNAQVNLAWVRRNGWGVLRLGLGYVW